MKRFFVFVLILLLACNTASENKPVITADSPIKDGTTIIQKPVVDTTADMLKPSVINNKAWERKKAGGVSWLGIGTEPFWSVERKKDSVIFHLADWVNPIALKATRTINTKDSVVYIGEGPSQKLQTSIIYGECSDGMSDRKYDYSVRVVYNGETYKGCAVIF
jgi:uncharacterized membrane protein